MNNLIFQICNTVALLAWIALIIFPYRTLTRKILFTYVVILLSATYTTLFLSFFNTGGEGGFSSLPAVTALFQEPVNVLVGWIHYLAFDLMVGLYIAKDAQSKGINQWLLLPSFLLTFMAGPMGLLIYFLIRVIMTKRLFQSYA